MLAGCGAGGAGGSSSGDMAVQPPAATAASRAPARVPPAVRSASVDIASFRFKPALIAVRRGGRVRWTNSDTASHTATADDRSFDTQGLDHGQSQTVTFSTPGRFPYHCDFHPFMKAVVVVR